MSNKNVPAGVLDFGAMDTAVESRLSFKPDVNLYGGLSIGKLLKVEVSEHEVSTSKEDGTPSSWEFAGMVLPNLVFEYEQVLGAKDPAKRYLVHTETIPATTDSNGTPIDLKLWSDLTTNLFKRLQHILNVMNDGELAPVDTKMKLPKISFSDPKEKRVADMKTLFTEFARLYNAKNAEGKVRYADAKFWMAVIAAPKTGNYYVLPSYVGKGYLEVFKQNVAPTIEIPNNATVELTKKTNKKEVAAKPDVNYQDVDTVARPVASANASTDDVLKQMGLA